MKNQNLRIIAAVALIITVVLVYFLISGILIPKGASTIEEHVINSNPELAEKFSMLKSFPPEIQGEIQTLATKYSIDLEWWGFDPYNNEIDLFEHGIHNSSATDDLREKQIGNYTIHIYNDTEFETTESDVRLYLAQLKKNPDYQISWIDMVTGGSIANPTGPYVELWVNKITPENQKLDNTVMKGWKILVYPMAPLPTNSSNSSSTISLK
jgi:hypothetical protein